MTPIEFPEQTIILAKDQPQYQNLPVHVADGPEFRMTSCWELSEEDKKLLLETGKIWLSQLTGGHNFQPVLIQVEKPQLEDNSCVDCGQIGGCAPGCPSRL